MTHASNKHTWKEVRGAAKEGMRGQSEKQEDKHKQKVINERRKRKVLMMMEGESK